MINHDSPEITIKNSHYVNSWINVICLTRFSYSNCLIYSVYAANIFILNIVPMPILLSRLTAVFLKVGLQCLFFFFNWLLSRFVRIKCRVCATSWKYQQLFQTPEAWRMECILHAVV